MSAALATFSAVAALTYGLWFCHGPPSFLRSVVKTLPVALLAVSAALEGGPLLLVGALAASALGDFALSRVGEHAFLVGLCSFAAAHLAYILLFVALSTAGPPVWAALLLVGYAASTERWLAPHTGDLRWPVRGYVVLITAMGITAFALPGGLRLALAGAVLFMASDTLLSLQLFRMGEGHRLNRAVSVALWALYYGAQALIAVAILA